MLHLFVSIGLLQCRIEKLQLFRIELAVHLTFDAAIEKHDQPIINLHRFLTGVSLLAYF